MSLNKCHADDRVFCAWYNDWNDLKERAEAKRCAIYRFSCTDFSLA